MLVQTHVAPLVSKGRAAALAQLPRSLPNLVTTKTSVQHANSVHLLNLQPRQLTELRKLFFHQQSSLRAQRAVPPAPYITQKPARLRRTSGCIPSAKLSKISPQLILEQLPRSMCSYCQILCFCQFKITPSAAHVTHTMHINYYRMTENR